MLLTGTGSLTIINFNSIDLYIASISVFISIATPCFTIIWTIGCTLIVSCSFVCEGKFTFLKKVFYWTIFLMFKVQLLDIYITCSRHQNLQNIRICPKYFALIFFQQFCITYFKALDCTPMQSELEKVAWFQYFALLLIKKKTKFCKQQKIGGFEYYRDSDVVNKFIKN